MAGDLCYHFICIRHRYSSITGGSVPGAFPCYLFFFQPLIDLICSFPAGKSCCHLHGLPYFSIPQHHGFCRTGTYIDPHLIHVTSPLKSLCFHFNINFSQYLIRYWMILWVFIGFIYKLCYNVMSEEKRSHTHGIQTIRGLRGRCRL